MNQQNRPITLDEMFAQFVVTRRNELGLSQSELGLKVFGEKPNLKQYISKIENQTSSPSLRTVQLILKALDAEAIFKNVNND